VVLLTSAILAFLGLVLLGHTGGAMVFVASAIFALGVAFFWPSMLGFASENIPQSGALGLAIMGGVGFLGGAIAQPVLGAIFDAQTAVAVPAGQTLEALKSAVPGTPEASLWAQTQLTAGAHTLLYMAIVPAILIIAFSYLYIYKRKHLTR